MKRITLVYDENWIKSDENLKRLPRRIEVVLARKMGFNLIAVTGYKFVFLAEDHKEAELYSFLKDFFLNEFQTENYEQYITVTCEEAKEMPRKEFPGFVEARRSETKNEKSEKTAEDNKTEEIEDQSGFNIDTLLEDVPMKHSEDLQKYLRETKAVIPVLRAMDNELCIWSQNLIVSIDTGFGLTTFLKTLVKVHMSENLVPEKEDASFYINEFVMEAGDEHAWDNLINAAVKCEEKAKYNKLTVFCVDISDYLADILRGKQTAILKELADISKHYITVFRVPFMEHSVVKDLENALSDVMNVRPLCVPPVHIEDMVEYMRNRLRKKGIESDDECNERLERQLMHEKSDDSFFGYKTLNKVIDKVIYDKAVKNACEGVISTKICKEDINVSFEEERFNPAANLGSLVGMEAIMEQVNMIVAQMTEHKHQKEMGMDIEKPAIHMMFTGNPGTGKTTVARIVAKILKQNGILRKGHVYEYRGRDLCGRYIGETAPKTSAICRDAYGSVLFIDEAYSLFRGENSSDRDYGREALDTLVAEMENHRDDLCVILAGYSDEMDTMLQGNRGLRSRIPYVIEFPNYTRDQLSEIFFKMLGNRFDYDIEFEEAVKDFFKELPDSLYESKEFSNARFVRNLYEKIWGKAAYRKNMNGDEKLVLLKTDLENAASLGEYKHLTEKKKKNTIGFI